MGVRGLMTYCRRIQRPVKSRKGLRIGIDAFSLIFLFREKRKEFADFLESLKKNHSDITFVMDKRAQKEKKETVNERKDIRNTAKIQANEVSTFTQTDEYEELDQQQKKILEEHLALKERDAWCMYPEYVNWVKGVVSGFYIPILMADEEADTLLSRGNYHAVISSDSDLLILGCNLWIPRIDSIMEISQTDFLELIGLQGEQLYELAFLCGCDIQPRKIVDIQTAISLLRFYGSLEKILERLTVLTLDDLSLYKQLRTSAWA